MFFHVLFLTANDDYIPLARDKLCKDDGYESIDNEGDCQSAAKLIDRPFESSGNFPSRPKGCFIETGFVYFNTNQNELRHRQIRHICRGSGKYKCTFELYEIYISDINLFGS